MISPRHRQVLQAPGLSSRSRGMPPLRISLMEKLISTHGFRVQKVLYQNARLSAGKKTGENQLKLILELRCFTLLLRATLIFGGFAAPASGPRENEKHDCFLQLKRGRNNSLLELPGTFRSSLIK